MRWTTIPLPADPGMGHPFPRVARTVATDAVLAELDARLDAAGLAHRLSPAWLAGLRDRTRDTVEAARAPAGVLDPHDAGHYVDRALDEARREGLPRAYAPPVRSRRP